MTYPSITIASHNHADLLLRTAGRQISHVISLNEPHTKPPRSLPQHDGEHLVLYFDDVPADYPQLRAPQKQDVQEILDFAEKIPSSSEVLIHCRAGISRSSAAALALYASRLPPSVESAEEAVRLLKETKYDIRPNALMVAYTDSLLGYNRALLDAHHYAWPEAYFREAPSFLDEFFPPKRHPLSL